MIVAQNECVLLGRLVELLLAYEWHHTLPHGLAQDLTLRRLQFVSLEPCQVLWNFYRQHLRTFPFFATFGSEYLSKLDQLLVQFIQRTGVDFAVALKTDILSFVGFYVSMGARFKRQVWKGIIDNSPVYWQRNMTEKRIWNTFSLYHPKPTAAALDPKRIRKMMRFQQCIFDLLSAFKTGFEFMNSWSEQKPWWQIGEKYETLDDFPEPLQQLLNSFVSFIAHVMDNVLDDKVRRKNFQSIMNKMPISILVYSAKWFNPAPFVERAMQLFLWSPSKSVHSLVQLAAALLCSFEPTRKRFAEMSDTVSEELVDLVGEIDKTDPRSSLSDEELSSILLEKGYIDADSREIQYLRLSLRVEEKKRFVDDLNDKSQKELILHICHCLPTFLQELAMFLDVSEVMSVFFECLNETLDVMRMYDTIQEHENDLLSDEDHATVIQELKRIWMKSAVLFYPGLKKLGKIRDLENSPKMWIGIRFDSRHDRLYV
ncbi:hypothetical protein EDD86DRAFT_60597 [Gorgonomyces haynaldii]|nr:hypothetical protein EDD86DRAFT_60597 [Gorgonomyces haynaldii]